MNISEEINASKARPTIDRMLLVDATSVRISQAIAKEHGIIFDAASIEKYRRDSFKSGDSPIQQIAKLAQDITNAEPPPTDEFARLSLNFSFKKTNDDLDLIYDRIKDLRKYAKENPEDHTYDRRIKDYLSQAEAIRTRVFRHQYEQIRHAILLTIGKKLCTASISILMPYIHREHKEEAMRRFQAAVEPLLDLKLVPEVPDNVTNEES